MNDNVLRILLYCHLWVGLLGALVLIPVVDVKISFRNWQGIISTVITGMLFGLLMPFVIFVAKSSPQHRQRMYQALNQTWL